jgi:hypothetical protein
MAREILSRADMVELLGARPFAEKRECCAALPAFFMPPSTLSAASDKFPMILFCFVFFCLLGCFSHDCADTFEDFAGPDTGPVELPPSVRDLGAPASA